MSTEQGLCTLHDDRELSIFSILMISCILIMHIIMPILTELKLRWPWPVIHVAQDMVQYLCLDDDLECEEEESSLTYLFEACDHDDDSSSDDSSSSSPSKRKGKAGKARGNHFERMYY